MHSTLWNELFHSKHVEYDQFIDSKVFTQASKYFESISCDFKYSIVLMVNCSVCHSAYTVRKQKYEDNKYKCKYCDSYTKAYEYKIIGIYYTDNFRKRLLVDYNKRIVRAQVHTGKQGKYYNWLYSDEVTLPNKKGNYFRFTNNGVKCYDINPTTETVRCFQYIGICDNHDYYTTLEKRTRLNPSYIKTIRPVKKSNLF